MSNKQESRPSSVLAPGFALPDAIVAGAEAVVILGPAGEIVHWNTGAENVFGLRAAEMIGQPFLDVMGSEDARLALATALAHLIADETADKVVAQIQNTPLLLDGRRADGSLFRVELRLWAMPVRAQRCAVVQIRDCARHDALQSELLRLATTDLLTGLMSRPHFLVRAENEIVRSWRTQSATSILRIDVDALKDVNARHGQAAGDAVLVAMASACVEELRTTDLLGRIEGDEMAALLPDTPLQDAAQVADRLRVRLGGLVHRTGDGAGVGDDVAGALGFTATVSIGVVEHRRGQETLEDTLRRAGLALDLARKRGGNRLWVDQGDEGPEGAEAAFDAAGAEG